MTLDLKTLVYHLDFPDIQTWYSNKEMLGYKEGEKYEDFFFRKHGYKHTEQDTYSKQVNVDLETQIAQLRSEDKIKNKNIQELTIQLKNMELQLAKLVKGYKSVSKLIQQT